MTGLLAAGIAAGVVATAEEIIHDGEYNFVAAQHKEAWAQQDQRVDAKLAEIQAKNGG